MPSNRMSHQGIDRANSSYKELALMALLHLPLMYAIMYTMVYSRDEVTHNLNMLYMAGMMVAPMVILMPLLMRGMYQNKKLNFIVLAASAGLFIILFLFERNQTFIGDKQFLRSMIPHHSGAILMCEEAKLNDAEIKRLCERIIEDQRTEIKQMKKILERM